MTQHIDNAVEECGKQLKDPKPEQAGGLRQFDIDSALGVDQTFLREAAANADFRANSRKVGAETEGCKKPKVAEGIFMAPPAPVEHEKELETTAEMCQESLGNVEGKLAGFDRIDTTTDPDNQSMPYLVTADWHIKLLCNLP